MIRWVARSMLIELDSGELAESTEYILQYQENGEWVDVPFIGEEDDPPIIQ